MSGFAGIVHLDHSLAEVAQASAMADFLAFRGPDARRVWHAGPAAFVHAALHTTPEAPHFPQPLTLDDRFVITGDIRLDTISDLCDRLRTAGEDIPPNAADALLVLQAYRVWGRDCLQRLAGDFCFALWDAAEGKLFCARDQFGIKPFFYARAGSRFVFSNTLECLLLHPALSDELDDDAIARFLLSAPEPADATLFRDIRRLPAAHWLECSADSLRTGRYWEVPTEVVSRHRRAADYADEFAHLFRQSVADRLRAPRVGVLMSGGMDSPSVAAIARDRLGAGAVHAYHHGFESLFDDVEPRWARRAADGLQIPFHFRSLDSARVLEACDRSDVPKPLPEAAAFRAAFSDLLGDAIATSRVVLTGEGGDVLLAPPTLTDGLTVRMLPMALHHWRTHHRLPQIGLRTALRRRAEEPSPALQWVRPELLGHAPAPRACAPSHPTRARAATILGDGYWGTIFEGYDPGMTGCAVEVRHPFFSVALVEFLFRIPLHRVDLFDKGILREFMKGILPDEIRRRHKTPLPQDPTVPLLQKGQWARACSQPPHERIWRYLRDGAPVSFAARSHDPFPAVERLRIVSLNCWLHQWGSHARNQRIVTTVSAGLPR